MYHTIGRSIFLFLEALLTFEQTSIQKASASLKSSIRLCYSYRRKTTLTQSIGNIMKRPNYDWYTPDELHVELCFAEALLLKALLTFIEDETLVSFIRAGIKIRSCYNSYKECNAILSSRSWSENEKSYKEHFESGVRLGIGAFNLNLDYEETHDKTSIYFRWLQDSESRNFGHNWVPSLYNWKTLNFKIYFEFCLPFNHIN